MRTRTPLPVFACCVTWCSRSENLQYNYPLFPPVLKLHFNIIIIIILYITKKTRISIIQIIILNTYLLLCRRMMVYTVCTYMMYTATPVFEYFYCINRQLISIPNIWIYLGQLTSENMNCGLWVYILWLIILPFN